MVKRFVEDPLEWVRLAALREKNQSVLGGLQSSHGGKEIYCIDNHRAHVAKVPEPLLVDGWHRFGEGYSDSYAAGLPSWRRLLNRSGSLRQVFLCKTESMMEYEACLHGAIASNAVYKAYRDKVLKCISFGGQAYYDPAYLYDAWVGMRPKFRTNCIIKFFVYESGEGRVLVTETNRYFAHYQEASGLLAIQMNIRLPTELSTSATDVTDLFTTLSASELADEEAKFRERWEL